MGDYAQYAQYGAQMYSGMAAKGAAGDDAAQLRSRARLRRAVGQREASEELRDARYLVSAARARAAASGGSLADPTLVNLFADIEAQGEMNALTRLWNAEEEARGDVAAGDARNREGQAAMNAATLNAAMSFSSKYG